MIYRLFLLITFLFIFSCEGRSLHLFQSYSSPHEKFILKIFYTDPPIYGPHNICFKVFDLESTLEIEKDCYELNNDGANLSDVNIRVDWLDRVTAQVVLNGQQQEADTLILIMNE